MRLINLASMYAILNMILHHQKPKDTVHIKHKWNYLKAIQLLDRIGRVVYRVLIVFGVLSYLVIL